MNPLATFFQHSKVTPVYCRCACCIGKVLVSYKCQLQILADFDLFDLSKVNIVDGIYIELDLEDTRTLCLARQLPNNLNIFHDHFSPMRCGDAQVTGSKKVTTQK